MATMVDTEFDRLKQVADKMKAQLADLRAQMGPTHESGGGWHDNSAFDHLKAEERRVSTDLARLDDFLATCQVIPREPDYDQVGVGALVTVRVTQQGHKPRVDKLMIAGDARPPRDILEVDSLHDVDEIIPVSTDSPVGKELMGAKLGDRRETTIERRRVVHYEVLALA